MWRSATTAVQGLEKTGNDRDGATLAGARGRRRPLDADQLELRPRLAERPSPRCSGRAPSRPAAAATPGPGPRGARRRRQASSRRSAARASSPGSRASRARSIVRRRQVLPPP
jgi:hypothetical protein